MSFSADVSRWINKTQLSSDVVFRKLGVDGFGGVLKRSPVDTGRFRASNRISVNKIDTSVEPPRENRSSKAGGTRAATATDLATASSKVSRAKFGDTIHITNSLPYAKPLENGSSAQTNNQPDGIYGATHAELVATLNRAIREARAS